MTNLKRFLSPILLVVLLSLSVFSIALLKNRTDTKIDLTLNNVVFQAGVADTQEARELGLGGRESLAEDEGLLIIFDKDGQWPVWMKDMQFAIDVLWLDSDKKIVHIVENMTPDTYPDSFFTSQTPSRYVVELNAGVVSSYNIELGQHAQFTVE